MHFACIYNRTISIVSYFMTSHPRYLAEVHKYAISSIGYVGFNKFSWFYLNIFFLDIDTFYESGDGLAPCQVWNANCKLSACLKFYIWTCLTLLDIFKDLEGFYQAYEIQSWDFNIIYWQYISAFLSSKFNFFMTTIYCFFSIQMPYQSSIRNQNISTKIKITAAII